MAKLTRALLPVCASTLLLTLNACGDSDGRRELLQPDPVASLPLVVHPGSFQLREGDTVSLEVRAGGIVVPPWRIQWNVKPANAAHVEYGSTHPGEDEPTPVGEDGQTPRGGSQARLVALRQSKDVEITATVGTSTKVMRGSIMGTPVELHPLETLRSTGVVGRSLDDSVGVLVLGRSGEPVEGVPVSFEVSDGGGTLSPKTSVSGAEGVARTAWTLGPRPGAHSVRASSADLEPVTVTAEAVPDFSTAAAHAVAGSGQKVGAGGLLPAPLTVEVRDSLGNPLPGIALAWSFSSGTGHEEGESGSGAASPLSVVTDAEGRSSVRWRVGTLAGSQKATVRVVPAASGAAAVAADSVGAGLVFEAGVDPGPLATLGLHPPGALLQVGSQHTLSISPADEFGNPIAETNVAWSSSDASIAGVDGDGVLTAHGPGAARITAHAGQVRETTNVEVSGGVPSIAIASGDGQSGVVGKALPRPLEVKVTTSGGQPLAGAPVAWTVSGQGATIEPVSVTTDDKGHAQAVLTLGSRAGGYTARATIGGYAAEFRATATAQRPSDQTGTEAVTDLKVTSVTSSTVTLRWTPVDAGAGHPARYALRYASPTLAWGSAYPTEVSVAGASNGASMQYTFGGLVPGRTYQFMLVPYRGTLNQNAVFGAFSNAVSATTSSRRSKPDAVEDLEVTSVTASTATLRWTQVDAGDGHPARYALRYASPTLAWGSAYSTEVSVEGTSNGTSTQYTFEGLEPGKTYQFMLVPYRGTLNQNAVFGPFSNAASAKTDPGTQQGRPQVSVTPGGVSLTSIQATKQLSAVARNASGATVSDPGFTWKSLNPQIATVSGSGLVRARSVGETAVVVSAACCGADTASVTVTRDNTSQDAASVSISPSSVSGLAPGATKQLSAIVKDRNGSSIQGATVLWKSTNPAVAAVTATGLVTAVAAGTAVITATSGGKSGRTDVSVKAIAPPPQSGGLLFSDDFEQHGTLAGRQNGVSWQSLGTNVSISTAQAVSGRHSLKFSYPARGDACSDSNAEQRFTLPNLEEVWLEYMFYLPKNFFHRKPSGCRSNAANQKLIRVWGPSAGAYSKNDPKGGASFDPKRERHGDSYVYLQWGDHNTTILSNQDPNSIWGTGFTDGNRGTWMRLRWHMKLASAEGASDGEMELWVNGKRVVSLRGLDWHSQARVGNWFSTGYLMGWANSSYAKETDFYIDDFKVYASNPGW